MSLSLTNVPSRERRRRRRVVVTFLFLSPGAMEYSLARGEDMRNVPPRKTGPKLPEAILFGGRVRKLREAKGWTQELLAEESGLNSVQISHIENGRNEPKLRTILWLAK